MKLQKPPRLHSPFSFWRQQASRKSVTGESSAYSGRPDEQVRLIPGSESQDNDVTYQHTIDHSNYPQRPAPRSPIHTERKHCRSDGLRHCHKPNGVEASSIGKRWLLTCSSSRWPNFANSQYKSSYTASNPSCSSASVSLQIGS